MANFKINQAESFTHAFLMGATPKVKFGSDEPDLTKDGLPKWELQVAVGQLGFGGKVQNEVIRVSYAGHEDPADGIGVGTPVQLIGLELGVMDKGGKVSVWFRCESVRSTAATGSNAKAA